MGRGNMNWSRLTLICLASCSFCLALPLADSAAEAEAVADAEAEARYGAYGGYYRTSARAGRRYSGHHGHYSHYGAHRGHNIQRYGYTFKGPIKAPAFKGPQSAPPTEELERFLDLRKSGRPAIRLGSSIGTPANTIAVVATKNIIDAVKAVWVTMNRDLEEAKSSIEELFYLLPMESESE